MDLIKVKEENCVLCHRCISVCPVKYCNDATGKAIKVNNDSCIQCGRCVDACEHDARYYEDDFDNFLSKPHDNLVFISAPSHISSWGMDYKKVVYFLKSYLKAKKVYDVSFGAEITVMKYLEAIKKNNLKCIISQPCPTVVKYIETYKPKLFQYLAPVESPAMAIAKYIREYLNFKGEIAFLSPCIAKSIEIKEKSTNNYINYNITHKKLMRYINERKINFKELKEIDFDELQAERGVGFSKPGGLRETVLRDFDEYVNIRKIEGNIIYEEYFDELIKNIDNEKELPLIIDVLNCEKGCNFGPGTLKNYNQDEVDSFINKRIIEQQKKYGGVSKFKKYYEKLKEKLKGDTFERKYNRKDIKFDPEKTQDDELIPVFQSMKKYEPKDFQNCRSCGYHTCKDMAIAILNKLNKIENCYFFMQKTLLTSVSLIATITTQIRSYLAQIDEKVFTIKMIFAEINNSFSITHDTLKNTKKANELLVALSQSFNPIVEAITDISEQTHILSVNAAIEAARAGTSGRGFAIVAHEVDKLSSNTAGEVEKITPMVKDLIQKINQINERSEVVIEDLNSVRKSYDDFFNALENVSLLIVQLSEEANKIESVNI